MQRKIVILLTLCAIVGVAGCRRSRPTKGPVAVQKESDFLYAEHPWDMVGWNLEPRKKDEKGSPIKTQAQLEKENYELGLKTNRGSNTMALGKFWLKYRANNPDARLYSADRLRAAVRQAKKDELPADTRDQIYDDLASGNMAAVFLAAAGPNSKHIVSYHKPVEKEATVQVCYGDGAGEALSPAAIEARIKEQELWFCWYYCVKFTMPNFCRTSAEGYDPSKQGAPPVYLANIRASGGLKIPPDAGDFKGFKKYVEKNAPPQLLELIRDNTLSVNLNADLSNPAELVACRLNAAAKKESIQPSDSMAINSSGIITPLPFATVTAWTQQNRSKD